jgi:hypothetical protein
MDWYSNGGILVGYFAMSHECFAGCLEVIGVFDGIDRTFINGMLMLFLLK